MIFKVLVYKSMKIVESTLEQHNCVYAYIWWIPTSVAVSTMAGSTDEVYLRQDLTDKVAIEVPIIILLHIAFHIVRFPI